MALTLVCFKVCFTVYNPLPKGEGAGVRRLVNLPPPLPLGEGGKEESFDKIKLG
jgi:hypothetical protein